MCRPFVLAIERDRIRERFMQQLDLALRKLLAELFGRGLDVSYFSVWNLIARADLSFN